MAPSFPFLYGAQYYRAPSPDSTHWADDLHRMARAGFNAVKFWCQWRWSCRRPGQYTFDDLDRLMDLADKAGLDVTINIIADVAPVWLLEQLPDAKMIAADGSVAEPRTSGSRQIGGFPGPCYNHPDARTARMEFYSATAAHFAGHHAMSMWDVWNEPEQNFLGRTPQMKSLYCYCPNCRGQFADWLSEKYESIDALNAVWARCYESFDQAEMPRASHAFGDFVDWRLFFLDVMAREAAERIEAVRQADPDHPVYLHPVPNTSNPFNSVTCVDDFQMSAGCDVWGGTIIGTPSFAVQSLSTARGKVCYNVESHMRAGSTTLYPRPLGLHEIVNEFVPQIGLGIRGFLFWQYRCETIGHESPGWGLLDVDGQPGGAHEAAVEFWKRLAPIAPKLMSATPAGAQTAIFKSTANEIFAFAARGKLDALARSYDNYTRICYRLNAPLCYVDECMVQEGLDDSIRLLILPEPYALTPAVAYAIGRWVAGGGTLISEAHLGAYDLSTGRHSTTVPGLGLAETLGLREINATSPTYLSDAPAAGQGPEMVDDVAKALAAMGISGSQVFEVPYGSTRLVGSSRYAELSGDKLTPLAKRPNGGTVIGTQPVGAGRIIYIGTLLGNMADIDAADGLARLIAGAMDQARVDRSAGQLIAPQFGLRVDRLETSDGLALAVSNRTKQPLAATIQSPEPMDGLFAGLSLPDQGGTIQLPAGAAELFVPARWTNQRE